MERLFEGASAMRLDGAALVDESFLADSCAMADSRFDAVAFAENVPLRDWASVFPNGRRSTHDARRPCAAGRGWRSLRVPVRSAGVSRRVRRSPRRGTRKGPPRLSAALPAADLG